MKSSEHGQFAKRKFNRNHLIQMCDIGFRNPMSFGKVRKKTLDVVKGDLTLVTRDPLFIKGVTLFDKMFIQGVKLHDLRTKTTSYWMIVIGKMLNYIFVKKFSIREQFKTNKTPF